MLKPEHDPFFEQLKKDIQEGVDSADQGELRTHDEVWRDMYALIERVTSEKARERSSGTEERDAAG